MAHTIVFFHAHPDDEAIATSGTMAKAKVDGHRVVLVVATRGELGARPDDLRAGETLADRRSDETRASAAVIGADRVEFLGYRDSGMEDDPRIHETGTFHSADLDEAAERLAVLLRDEQASVLVGYDERGNYLHPDHVKVHHVAHRAVALAGTPLHYEATMNRDHIWNLMNERQNELEASGIREQPLGNFENIEEFNLGMREWFVTHCVDVRDYVAVKRAAMIAHASQIDDTSFFLRMPDEAFAESFGYEWFIRPGFPRAPSAPFEHDLFAPLASD
jgi:LmbE family N-acetylglucosaminyl deacetylase